MNSSYPVSTAATDTAITDTTVTETSSTYEIRLDECFLPGACRTPQQPQTIPNEGPNTEENLSKLSCDYERLKQNILKNPAKQRLPQQGTEIEIISHSPNNVESFARQAQEYFPPPGGVNTDPETWPRALEINTKGPSQIAHFEEWYIGVAKVLQDEIASGHSVCLASAQSTVAPEDLTLKNLTPKPRTQALANSMPGELTQHHRSTVLVSGGLEVQISPEELLLTDASRSLRIQGAEGGQLSFVSKAPLGALQIHLSGDPREMRDSAEVSHAAGHNSAAVAQLFGMAVGASSPCFAGFYSPVADLRLPIYQATVGPRRAPLGSQWFGDDNILQIFDDVLCSNDPLLIDPNDTGKRTSGSNLALNAMKTVWPPTVRPTVTFDKNGNADVHPELRALGTPHTLHDAVAISLFVAGLWKEMPNHLEEKYGVDISNPESLEKSLSYQSFVDSIWSTSLHGLSSNLHWFDGKTHPAKDLILDEMLPVANKGLISLGLPPHARELYLGGIKKNIERGIDSSTLERLFDVPGQDPEETRIKLHDMHQKVTERSIAAFLQSRYEKPYFLADAYDDMRATYELN